MLAADVFARKRDIEGEKVIVCIRIFFWEVRNGTSTAKLQFVLRELTAFMKALTVRCLIIILELPHCEMKRKDTKRLPGVTSKCPTLTFVRVIYCHSKLNVVQSNRLYNLKSCLVVTCRQFRYK